MSSDIPNLRFKREPLWLPSRRVLGCDIPPQTMDWLMDSSSLTQRLIQACPGQFSVQVIDQGYGLPMKNESRWLDMAGGTYGFIRQVRLLCNKVPWVYARTVIPVSTLSGRLRRLTRLGNKPLGALLFADSGMRRGEMEIARIQHDDQIYQSALGTNRKAQQSCDIIWGRRSTFYLDYKPLLVSEIFLPGIGPCKPCERCGAG